MNPVSSIWEICAAKENVFQILTTPLREYARSALVKLMFVQGFTLISGENVSSP